MNPLGPGPRFAVAVTCMDGRVQEALADWVRRRFEVDHVDMLTAAGADAVVVQDAAVRARLLADVALSRRAHGSKHLVLASHSDCAANPGDQDEHQRSVRAGLELLAAELPGMTVVGVHVVLDAVPVTVVELPGRVAGPS